MVSAKSQVAPRLATVPRQVPHLALGSDHLALAPPLGTWLFPRLCHRGAVKRFFLILVFGAAIARAEDMVFPDDAVVDVTKAPYSAKGDGAADDTAAIQKALDEGRHLIYLPNGTYLISNGLRWGKTQKHTVLQGQSRDGTIIKLKDECGGFNLPDKPLPMIWTGKSPPIQRFGNGIRNLTVDTGRGNPGAIGIQFAANHQGTIDTVRIRCGESGPVGLDLSYAAMNGPCFITHLEVNGFDNAISTAGRAEQHYFRRSPTRRADKLRHS